jgi:WD40 repeat protein
MSSSVMLLSCLLVGQVAGPVAIAPVRNLQDQDLEDPGLIGHRETTAIYSPDGKYLATANSFVIRVRRTDDWKVVWEYTWEPKADKGFLPTVRTDGYHATAPGAQRFRHDVNLAYSPDGRFLASQIDAWSRDRIGFWNAVTGELQNPPDPQGGHAALSDPQDGQYKSIAFMASGRQVVGLTGSQAPPAVIWDAQTYQRAGEISIQNISDWRLGSLTSLAASPTGNALAIGTEQGVMISRFDRPNRVTMAPLKLPREAVRALAFSSDGRMLVVAGSFSANRPGARPGPPNGQPRTTLVSLWDMNSGRQLSSINYPNSIGCVAIAPGGGFLAIGQNSGGLALWDIQRKAVVADSAGRHFSGQDALTMDPRGNWLVSAGQGGPLLWDVSNFSSEPAVKFQEEPAAEGPAPQSRPAPPDDAPAMRTWTDATGAYAIEATLTSYVNGKAVLKKSDGRTIAIETTRLSAPDQEYVKAWVREKRR